MYRTLQLQSLILSLLAITWGLLIHPYQTMQSLLREKSFVWMCLLPSVAFLITKTIWLWVVVPLVRFVFTCHSTPLFACDLIPFFANWLTFFLVYWQILLLYLLIRFAKAFKIRY